MIEFLRDNWQFIVGIGTLSIPIILYFRQLRHKKLSYEIISQTPLLSVEEKNKGNWEIRFNGKLVEDVHLIEVEIKNSGNEPIKSEDYERPINLSFGGNTQILSAELIDAHPNSIQAPATIEGTKVKLLPILLNGGDSITLKMLVSQFSGQEHDIKVDGRIADVKDIKMFTERNYGLIIGISGFLLLLIDLIILERPKIPSVSFFFDRLIDKFLFSLGFFLFLIGSIAVLSKDIREMLKDLRR